VTAEYDDLTVVAEFLARRDEWTLTPDHPVDVLVLCGSAVLQSLTVAAAALANRAAARILVTGGIGHSTPYLGEAVAAHPVYRRTDTAGRTEAAVIAEILQRYLDVPAHLLGTEVESTNCGQNAELSLRILAERTEPTRSLVIVQDPTMQRRTHAAFERWRGDGGPEIRSHAPFVPVVGQDGAGEPGDRAVWTLDRFRALVLGEIRRLTDDEHGYGPRGAGFITHVDIPDDVVAAHRRLRAGQPGTARDLTPRDGPVWGPSRL
jgi:uncharacterized SAM-binding protein YcdF (DUF218 family)